MGASGGYTAKHMQNRLHNQSRILTLVDRSSYLVGWLSICDPDLGIQGGCSLSIVSLIISSNSRNLRLYFTFVYKCGCLPSTMNREFSFVLSRPQRPKTKDGASF